jgi:hypothetical protein
VSALRATPFLNRPPPPHPASLPRAARPLHAHQRPPELPRSCWTPLLDAVCAASPSAHRSGAPLPSPPCPAPPLCPPRDLRQHLTIVEPPLSHWWARHHAVPRAARACCGGPRGSCAPLGRAARPQPCGCFGRPRMAGRHAPWDVASGRFSAQYYARGFTCFSVVLNSRNCFKLQKFVETCRNVQNLQHKFCMNPLQPLFTVGLTKLTFMQ